MHLFALDEKKTYISAITALSSKDYFCPECGGIVRVRRGLERSFHFFHLRPTVSCTQRQKGPEHIFLQSHVQNLFQPTASYLEYPFPNLKRIADVFVPKFKLIIEIQCSPISFQEIEKRISDYTSLNFKIIWLLHTKIFNQRYISSAEKFLLKCPHYFTNFDSMGNGMIFDQFSFIKGRFRIFHSPRYPIEVDKIQFFSDPTAFKQIPRQARFLFSDRIKEWKLTCKGDVVDLLMKNPQKLEKFYKHYSRLFSKKLSFLFFLKKTLNFLTTFYQTIFHLLLEKST